MIAFPSVSILQIQLPVGDDHTGQLYLMALIRNQLNCIIEYNISSVIVLPDSTAINDLVTSIQSASSPNNPIVQLLVSGNQNTVGQILTSFSQQFNKMNTQILTQLSRKLIYIIINRIHKSICTD